MPALKILIVEDEAITAIMLAETLGDLGYTVARPVATAEAAVSAAAEFQPDIILMDVHLAGAVNGIQAAAAIRENRQTDFIFMTGYADAQAAAELEQLQPLARLIKPVSPETINNIILSSGRFPDAGSC